MPQSDPALAIRISSQQREEALPVVDGDRPRLRLVVTKGKLGVELDASFTLGPLSIEELTLSFPEVRFPVELSGGVHTFRNRRGELEHIRLRLNGAAARAWAAPRLAKVMAEPVVHHTVSPLEEGFLIGVATQGAALAFEVMLAPLDGDLRLLPVHARALGLGEPPQALAMRVLAALTAPFGKARGSAVIIERGPMELARGLLPLAGMRAPAARKLAWSDLTHDLEGATLLASRHHAPLEVTERVVSTVELAALVADAEQHLLVGALDDARRGYLLALTRAPRHLAIARRLAELDHACGDRAEAALSTLSDVLAPVDGGPLGAALLEAVGDQEGARVAWRRAAMAEPYGPLAAMCWSELGRLSLGEAAARALDEAIARAPTLTGPRWRRFEELVRHGQVARARADVEHLEALAGGAQERLEVLRRAADFLLGQRVLGEANELFERALRYAPSDVESVAGLARSLALTGQRRRALELWSRAAAWVDKNQQSAPRVVLDYAQALAEVADDRPAAIARIAGIEHLSAGSFEARLLEARWRAELGDLSGAHASLVRLADALETVMPALLATAGGEDGVWSGPKALYRTRADARRALAALAEEGARIHELDRDDAPAARRLLEAAIRLAPRVSSIRSAYKRVAGASHAETHARAGARAAAAGEALSAERIGAFERLDLRGDAQTRADPPSSESPNTKSSSTESPVSPTSLDGPFAPAASVVSSALPSSALSSSALSDTLQEDAMAEAVLESRAEVLTQQVRGNPNDEAAVAELADVLERLARFHDLLALLSARIDEATREQRPPLVVRRNSALRRMIEMAEREGRLDEAELYALMIEE